MDFRPPAPTLAPASPRILSVDALRGFDMFWIIGGEGFVAAILQLCGPKAQQYLLPQLNHAEWEGFRFYDLIFPLFAFMVGMSTVFSLGRILVLQGKGAAYRRLITRSVVLFLFGLFYYGGLSHRWPDIRLMGVLQRLALCYLFTGIVFIHCRRRGALFLLVVLLVGYWGWLSFVKVPGVEDPTPMSRYAPGTNWANYIDSQYLIGKRYDGKWDPEGLLSTLPAVATGLLGMLAGLLLKNPAASPGKKVAWLIGGGLLCLVLGYGWGGQLAAVITKYSGYQLPWAEDWGYPFPVIKKIWTSSYVLVAGGYSYLLMGIFYLVIDVWKLQRWTAPFMWIGTNAITLYMAWNIIDFHRLALRLANGNLQDAIQKAVGESYGQQVGHLLISGVAVGLVLLLAHFLYRRRIFLRV
jgi:predicted acyltransferase